MLNARISAALIELAPYPQTANAQQRRLASIGTQSSVNPIRDLRPVCPNCHAVIHSTTPPRTIDQVRAPRTEKVERALVLAHEINSFALLRAAPPLLHERRSAHSTEELAFRSGLHRTYVSGVKRGVGKSNGRDCRSAGEGSGGRSCVPYPKQTQEQGVSNWKGYP
jgi:hypothetical protein